MFFNIKKDEKSSMGHVIQFTANEFYGIEMERYSPKYTYFAIFLTNDRTLTLLITAKNLFRQITMVTDWSRTLFDKLPQSKYICFSISKICMHTCMHMYMHTYIHTYTHTHIHTYIYTYTGKRLYIAVCRAGATGGGGVGGIYPPPPNVGWWCPFLVDGALFIRKCLWIIS